MASIQSNRNTYNDPRTWNRCGDTWTFHAENCNQPYDTWKRSVVDTFLDPYLGPNIDALEVGPGYGRWSEFMVGQTRTLKLVDISVICIDACRERFGDDLPDDSFIVSDGRTLPVPDESLDLVWSFGTFVHVDEPDVAAYLSECGRVLRPGGRFVIHHAGWSDWTLHFVPMTRPFGRAGKFVQHRALAVGRWSRVGGRAPMTADRFRRIASRHDLIVEKQVSSWGDDNEFSIAFRDVISIGTKVVLPPIPTLR
jgi:SAM-dependent methyltransferase